MDFDSRLQIGIMVYLDIRIAPANMGENHRILAALAERFIKIGDCVGVILQLVPLFQQRVRASSQRAALIGVDHVAVAAHGRIARPFIARKGGEPSRLVPLCCDRVQMIPEFAFDLEIIALVTYRVEKGAVAGKIHIILDPADADRLAALPVQVAPETGMLRLGNDQWPGGEIIAVVG